jgi:hypothetical protein
MQFGGVSATHLDWTMVPYVRKSFWKHFKDGFDYMYEVPHKFFGGSIYQDHLKEMREWMENKKFNNTSIEDGK